MIYQIIQIITGAYDELSFEAATPQEAVAIAATHGFECHRFNENPNHREELRGQPKFSGLAGPMWGGPGKVRYETPEVYQEMSQ